MQKLGMLTQAQIDALLQRFESSQATEADRLVLRQLLLADRQTTNGQADVQDHKYDATVTKAQNVHIGDIYEGPSTDIIQKTIQSTLEALQQTQNQKNHIPRVQNSAQVDDTPLELLELNIEPQTVEWINSRLTTIENLRSAGYLIVSEQEEFRILQNKIEFLSNVNQNLQDIKRSSDRLFQKAIRALETKLKEVRSAPIDSLSKVQSFDCLAQQLELLQQFQIELEQGQEVARWLDRQRPSLAKVLGQHALQVHIAIKQSTSLKEIQAFYFTIELLLERLSHCLIWGRTNSLKTFKVPIVLNDSVYETAFTYLRKLVLDDNDLPDEGVGQLNEYVEHLIQNLPNYRHISMG